MAIADQDKASDRRRISFKNDFQNSVTHEAASGSRGWTNWMFGQSEETATFKVDTTLEIAMNVMRVSFLRSARPRNANLSMVRLSSNRPTDGQSFGCCATTLGILMVFILILWLVAVPIVHIVMGTIFECKFKPEVELWPVILGVSEILNLMIVCLILLEVSMIFSYMTPIIDLLNFIWVIIGCVWIFGLPSGVDCSPVLVTYCWTILIIRLIMSFFDLLFIMLSALNVDMSCQPKRVGVNHMQVDEHSISVELTRSVV